MLKPDLGIHQLTVAGTRNGHKTKILVSLTDTTAPSSSKRGTPEGDWQVTFYEVHRPRGSASPLKELSTSYSLAGLEDDEMTICNVYRLDQAALRQARALAVRVRGLDSFLAVPHGRRARLSVLAV
jgi:hypothetical protein